MKQNGLSDVMYKLSCDLHLFCLPTACVHSSLYKFHSHYLIGVHLYKCLLVWISIKMFKRYEQMCSHFLSVPRDDLTHPKTHQYENTHGSYLHLKIIVLHFLGDIYYCNTSNIRIITLLKKRQCVKCLNREGSHLRF